MLLDDIKVAETPEEWVALACGPALENRSFLPFVYVLDGTAYASDGIRLHYAKTEFPDGVYDAKFCPVDWQKATEPGDIFDPTSVSAWLRISPKWENMTRAQISEIVLAGIGPVGEDRIKVSWFGTSVYVRRSYLAEAHNRSASIEVFFQLDAPASVAGASNFGHYRIATYKDRK